MATRRIMVGDQEVQIPDFNFKITPVLSWDHLALACNRYLYCWSR